MATLKITPSDTADVDDRIVSSKELHSGVVPWTRSTTWRLVRDGKFPAPMQVTAALRGWRLSTIRAWMDAREQNPVAARAYFPKKRTPSTEPVASA